MKRDIRQYVGSCVVCQLLKTSTQKPMGQLMPLKASDSPFERVAVDKFGAIQNSRDGFKYVFLAVDFCTRYVIAEAVHDGSARTAAAFMRKILLEHKPYEVLSDNGSEFKADFAELLTSFDVLHTHSTPRHPRTNGLVERANQSISQIMKTTITDSRHDDWADALQPAVRTYNTSVHEVTRFTPYYLLFGLEPRSSRLLGEVVSDQMVDFQHVMHLNDARRLAAARTTEHRVIQKRRYDKKRRPCDLRVGDLVTVEVSTLRKGQSERFNARRRGPFEVTSVGDNNTVLIRGSSATTRVNIERCLKLRRRPPHLMYNDGVDDIINAKARGRTSNQEGEGDAHTTNPGGRISNQEGKVVLAWMRKENFR